ncbi:YuzB family protein [Cohnella hashimotonis]|uniref:YuzB family protein n=1 Tax=Cohnella hashimotonis TaxID=2826895 RepID=A0ABT6TD77_9BACL|nr:YuzB family protein [Cohnella hashimotonis]MDI4644273.1 YuzB family protein [Cohnella hashimotonis]
MNIVEFCVSNAHHGTDRLIDKLNKLPDLETIEYGCLGNCGECYLSPYVMVNGATVVAETAEALYDAIMEELGSQDEHRRALDKLLDDL